MRKNWRYQIEKEVQILRQKLKRTKAQIALLSESLQDRLQIEAIWSNGNDRVTNQVIETN